MANAPKRFRFYKGQPVKRMRQGPSGIILTMLSPVKGEAGQQLTITQSDWESYGEWRELDATTMDEVRELAAS